MLKARYYGLIGAGAFALGAAGLVATLVLRSGPRPAPIDDADAPVPPDIREALPTNQSQGSMAGRDLRIQLMDKDDPTRQSGELRAALIDPLPLAGHYEVERPQIWMFMTNGKTLSVRADSGRLVMPSRRQEPESGVLRGNVVVRIYDVVGVGNEEDLGPPSLTATTQTLTFDTTVPELGAPQSFTITGRGVRFEGQSLRVLASQTRERLELVEVLGGGSMVYTPSEDIRPAKPETPASAPRNAHTTQSASAQPPKTNASTAPSSGSGGSTLSASPATAPVEVHYLTTFADDVVVTQQERVLQGDRLDVWALLVDGRLPEGAIGGSSGPKTTEPQRAQEPQDASNAAAHATPKADASPDAQPVIATAADSESQRDQAADESVRLQWTGPMVARPLPAKPRELQTNDVWLRVTADRSGVVRLDDTATGATGRCAVLEYGATTQDLAISRPGTEGATLAMPGQGQITAVRIEQNLGTGVGHVPGAGTLVSFEDEGATPSMATWRDSATFVFDAPDGRMTDRIREATLIGGVNGASQGSNINAEVLRASFTSPAGAHPVLTRAIAEERVVARDANGNVVTSEVLDVAFKPGEKESEPTLATAKGNVRATSAKGETLSAGLVEAELGRDDEGRLGATSVVAFEWVEAATPDGLRALTPELRAQVPTQMIDLVGPASKAMQQRGGMTTVIEGERIRLDGGTNAVSVSGPGTFAHRPDDAASLERSVFARWAESMQFDDTAGTLNARGDVHAEGDAGGFERQALDADVLIARLRPAADHERLVREARRAGRPAPEREILFAQAITDATAEGGGTESRVQHITYAQSPDAEDGRRLERLFQAYGATITADNEGGFIEIPGPGRLVLADLREEERPRESSASPLGGGSASRGRSLFDWTGSMRFDRGPGVIQMSESVSMVQRRLDDSVLNVTSRTLQARVRETSEGSGEPQFQMTGVTATGDVVVTERTGTPLTLNRQIFADLLEYDTVRGTAEATASGNGRVTLYEASRGSPIQARRVFWDLVRDRIDVSGMSSTTGPR